MSKRRQDVATQGVSLAKRASSATRRVREQTATRSRPAAKGGASAIRGEGKSTAGARKSTAKSTAGARKSTAKSTAGERKSTAKSTAGARKSTAKKTTGTHKPIDSGPSFIGWYQGRDDWTAGIVAWPVLLFKDGIVITHAANLKRALGVFKIVKQGLSGIPTIGGANPALRQNLADRDSVRTSLSGILARHGDNVTAKDIRDAIPDSSTFIPMSDIESATLKRGGWLKRSADVSIKLRSGRWSLASPIIGKTIGSARMISDAAPTLRDWFRRAFGPSFKDDF